MSGTRQTAFHTGDSAWDNALGTISGALFPDPTKAGQAYYYGSEARAKQIEGYKNIQEVNAGNRAYGMLPGSGVPYSPIQFTQPPIAGMGPIMAPASNLPMQAPPAPVNGSSLGGTVAQGSPLAPGGQPFTGGGTPPPPIGVSPATLGQIVAPGTEPYPKGYGTTGTPPPASPPAPGAPPAPNTTTSNGQPPGDNQGDGAVHPGWVSSPDGGKKYSPPAAANGTPAPAPFDLGTYLALQASAGRNAEMAKVQAIGYITDAENRGILPQGTAEKMSANFGSSVFESKQATGRNAATVAGGIRQAQIHEQGATDRAGMPLQDIIDPTDPTKITRTPLSQLQNSGGTPSYNPAAVADATKNIDTQPGGPGTPVYGMPTNKAQEGKVPLYQSQANQAHGTAMSTVGDYVNPKDPTQLLPRTLAQAQAEGLVAVPKTPEAWTALATSAAANAKTPEEAEAIKARVLAAGGMGTGKPQDPIENLRNSNLIDRQLQKLMPVPQSSYPGQQSGLANLSGVNTGPAGASPALQLALTNLTDQYFTKSTNSAIRGNRIAAADEALKQMMAEGYIDPQQSRTMSWTGDHTTTKKGVVNKDGSVTQTDHFQVHLVDPKTKQPLGPDKVPQIQMKGASPLSSVVAEGKNYGSAEGKPEGTTGTLDVDGRKVRVIVKNGNYVEVPGGS